ncbi:cytidylyltransferase domain-containing protein [Halobaculum sp. MBLA0147]|uniref:acylneuraminate cytidylyltransferase family protein n=1 Tax=Halobaculum sp. MBLA0147 TaxID=3079934 RepID=UPI003525A169
MSTSVLGLIPARGGSKRVPRKNVREVGGKPLVARTVEQAAEAETVDEAIVSTDDEEIERVAEASGGSVPFRRPAELATDESAASDVVTHALDWAADAGKSFDVVALLQVTTPLRDTEDIDGTVRSLLDADAESAVSVSAYHTPPQWAVTIGEDGRVSEQFDPPSLFDAETDRSQELTELYHPNGAVFAATVEAWREHESFYTPDTVAYEMPPERSFDIDEPWELSLVRELL